MLNNAAQSAVAATRGAPVSPAGAEAVAMLNGAHAGGNNSEGSD